MNKQAYKLYKELKKPKTSIVSKIEVSNFSSYLLELVNEISTRRNKQDFIIRNTFKLKIKNSIDERNYIKANIMSAEASFRRFTDSIDLNNVSELQKKILIDYVCDLKSFVNYFDSLQDYSWLMGNTNSHISNFYYSLSKNIFSTGQPGNHSEEIKTLQSSTPFFIRQSIEYKIKRIIGIDYWTINGKPDLQTVKKCFKLLEDNQDLFDSRNFNLKLIEVIYSWTNTYIHGGYRANPWKIETAINYLKELFYKGELSQKKSFSIYGGIETTKKDLIKFRSKVEESLMNINHQTEIRWLHTSEIAIVKKRKNG